MCDTAGGAKDELMSDVLLWTLTYGCVSVEMTSKKLYYISSVHTQGCSFEDPPGTLSDKDR